MPRVSLTATRPLVRRRLLRLKRLAYDRVLRHVGVPAATMRPYALPGAASFYHARWRASLRRSPAVSVEEHAARVRPDGLAEIEEVTGCLLCGGRTVQPLWEAQGPKRGRWSYHVVRCTACGLLFRHPGIRPERLGDLYAKDAYEKFLTGSYSKERAGRYELVMDAFAPVFAEGAGRRLLDFGSGAGLFLEVAHRRGFDGHGVDLSRASVEVARQRPGGAKSHFGSPLDVPEIAAGGFDAITMWSVLAHLPRPVDDLTMLRGLLAPDGVLLVLTVNANSLLLKAWRRRWNGFTPNHLAFFAPDTLSLLLRKAGFEAVLMRPMYGDDIERGASPLPAWQMRKHRRTIEDGNQGNMLRAVAFADAGGPARWGLEADAMRL
jgi:SAM-dependent methyltransferase